MALEGGQTEEEFPMILSPEKNFNPDAVMIGFLVDPPEVGSELDRYGVADLAELRKLAGKLSPRVLSRNNNLNARLNRRIVYIQAHHPGGRDLADAMICHDLRDIKVSFATSGAAKATRGRRSRTLATAIESVNVAKDKDHKSHVKTELDQLSLADVVRMDDRRWMSDRDYLWVGAMMADLAVQRELDPDYEIDAFELEVMENMTGHFFSELAARTITMPVTEEKGFEKEGRWADYRAAMDLGACDANHVLEILENTSPILIDRTLRFLWNNSYDELLHGLGEALYFDEVAEYPFELVFRKWDFEKGAEIKGVFNKIRHRPVARKIMNSYAEVIKAAEEKRKGEPKLLEFDPDFEPTNLGALTQPAHVSGNARRRVRKAIGEVL